MHNHAMGSTSAFRFIPAIAHAPTAMASARAAVVDPLVDPLVDPHRATETFEVAREDGLELLEWLGLGRPEFGAIRGRELAPLCRRRLWNVARNANTPLRARTQALLEVAERAGEGMVLFG